MSEAIEASFDMTRDSESRLQQNEIIVTELQKVDSAVQIEPRTEPLTPEPIPKKLERPKPDPLTKTQALRNKVYEEQISIRDMNEGAFKQNKPNQISIEKVILTKQLSGVSGYQSSLNKQISDEMGELKKAPKLPFKRNPVELLANRLEEHQSKSNLASKINLHAISDVESEDTEPPNRNSMV